MKRAVFPGSFDPITLGHVEIINRGLELFDEIIVAVGVNTHKKYMWSLEERLDFIRSTFADNANIKVASYEGLTVDFCHTHQANFLLRGLRNALDYSYEKSIAQTNLMMGGIESVFIICSPGNSHISSTIVRDIAQYDGDYSTLVPKGVYKK